MNPAATGSHRPQASQDAERGGIRPWPGCFMAPRCEGFAIVWSMCCSVVLHRDEECPLGPSRDRYEAAARVIYQGRVRVKTYNRPAMDITPFAYRMPPSATRTAN
jgi:hypothetical protein